MLGKVTAAAVILAGLAGASAVQADTLSPIFGSAAATPTTTVQNRSIVGKGYYADYFGSYGINFASTAAAYGQYGDYTSAAAFANAAYQYFDAASYYQSLGQ